MSEDANAARQVITLPAQNGMTTQPPTPPEFASVFANLNAAMDAASGAIRVLGAGFARESRRIHWDLRIIFADTEKDRRRLIRDMDREYRRPALIHKGGKP